MCPCSLQILQQKSPNFATLFHCLLVLLTQEPGHLHPLYFTQQTLGSPHLNVKGLSPGKSQKSELIFQPICFACHQVYIAGIGSCLSSYNYIYVCSFSSMSSTFMHSHVIVIKFHSISLFIYGMVFTHFILSYIKKCHGL